MARPQKQPTWSVRSQYKNSTAETRSEHPIFAEHTRGKRLTQAVQKQSLVSKRQFRKAQYYIHYGSAS